MSTPYQDVITIEPGKRGGRPVIRGLRITVGDMLGWLAAGMSSAEIVEDFPELTEADIRAVLAFAADRERRPLSHTQRAMSSELCTSLDAVRSHQKGL